MHASMTATLGCPLTIRDLIPARTMPFRWFTPRRRIGARRWPAAVRWWSRRAMSWRHHHHAPRRMGIKYLARDATASPPTSARPKRETGHYHRESRETRQRAAATRMAAKAAAVIRRRAFCGSVRSGAHFATAGRIYTARRDVAAAHMLSLDIISKRAIFVAISPYIQKKKHMQRRSSL